MYAIKKMFITSFSILLLAASSAVLAVSPPSTVVLSGIDSPRGMDLDSKGNLYIASAGYGGSGKPFKLTRSSFVGPICQGNSGKVYKVTPQGKVTTVIDGLPSHADCQDFDGGLGLVPKGSVAAGPQGLKVSENNGKVTLLMTFSGSTEVTSDFCLPGGAFVIPGSPQTVGCLPGFAPLNPYSLVLSLAQLWGLNVFTYNTVGQVDLSNPNPYYQVLYGQMIVLEDLFNPDQINTAGLHQFPYPTNKEDDVYDLLKLNDRILAVDAGGNDIWSLKNGVATLAVVMPNIGCSKAPCTVGTNLPQSVPTAIAQNPINGKIYLGELAGFGNPGAGRIFQADFSTVPATLSQVTISGALTGLNGVVAMDFDKHGNLFVVEYNASAFTTLPVFGGPGAIIKLHFTDELHAVASVFDDTLLGPTGITIGNGKLYVGNKQDTGLHQAEVRAYNIP